MIHVCKNPEMGGGFHFLAHGLFDFGHFTLLFGEVQQRKVPKFIRYM